MSHNESIVEDALTWFVQMDYAVGHGPHLAPVAVGAAATLTVFLFETHNETKS